MTIEHFVAQCIGEWRSMRTGHSLAFQIFEDVTSEIRIKSVREDSDEVKDLLIHYEITSPPCSPFHMSWEADSDWEPENSDEVSKGECLLIPIPTNASIGQLIRSVGYAEQERATANYEILGDGTFILTTEYGQSIAEERIWFVSENVRCRSSVIKTSGGSGILQTSFASEVRRVEL